MLVFTESPYLAKLLLNTLTWSRFDNFMTCRTHADNTRTMCVKRWRQELVSWEEEEVRSFVTKEAATCSQRFDSSVI